MSQFPRVIIDIPKLIQNYQTILARCSRNGLHFTGVLKGIAGDRKIIEAFIAAGIQEIGDSRLENLQKIRPGAKVRRMLLRLPALSRIKETLELSDVSLNSEQMTLECLDSFGERHQAFLMIDMGDLREGVVEKDFWELGRFCMGLKYIQITGVGTNFSCFAGAIPTVDKLKKLVRLADWLTAECKLPIQFISGGNSSSLPWLYSENLPQGINHLRIGEGILLGRETLGGGFLSDLHHDVFIIEAEIIQAQWKKANPEGETGYDAFGRKPCLPQIEDGVRLLINFGHQDAPLNGLTPLDSSFTVMGGSSDYLVVASEKMCKVGETIQFLPNYWSMLGVMTSPYVEKVYIV